MPAPPATLAIGMPASILVDAQGREIALRNAFHLHQLAHTHNLKVFDLLMDPTGLPEGTRKALASRAKAPGKA